MPDPMLKDIRDVLYEIRDALLAERPDTDPVIEAVEALVDEALPLSAKDAPYGHA